MGLSNDLLSQFAKVTKSTKQTKKETTVYGTVKEYDNELYVQIDGSDLLTPMSTTTDMKNGERVVVQIKDHSATILGNVSSPSATTTNVAEADKVIADEVQTEKARINNLEANNVTINNRITAAEGDIKQIKSDMLSTANLEAINAEITNLKTTKLDASTALITYATIESLNTANANITSLQTNKLDTVSADAKYANINFANINMTSVENVFAKSGIIKDLVVSDASISGELVGVTIRGDLIVGNTIVADKLVVKGEDGLYYKLNADGEVEEENQTDYNSLKGNVIMTKSITASKIIVDDLSAFDATIGGFKLTENSIYSGVKTAVDNTTNGIYLDDEGQIAFGGSSNFVKYYKDQNGNYKLEISADNINLNSSNLGTTLADLQTQIDRINEYCNIS